MEKISINNIRHVVYVDQCSDKFMYIESKLPNGKFRPRMIFTDNCFCSRCADVIPETFSGSWRYTYVKTRGKWEEYKGAAPEYEYGFLDLSNEDVIDTIPSIVLDQIASKYPDSDRIFLKVKVGSGRIHLCPKCLITPVEESDNSAEEEIELILSNLDDEFDVVLAMEDGSYYVLSMVDEESKTIDVKHYVLNEEEGEAH